MKLSDMLPQGDHWVTLENGQHVLIDSSGVIKQGMGGKFNGRHISQAHKEGIDSPEPFSEKQKEPALPEGHERLERPLPIERETEKAYGVANPAYLEAKELHEYGGASEVMRRGSPAAREAWRERASLNWVPKSQATAHEGHIIGMSGWMARKGAYRTKEGAAAKAAAFSAGKERYESLLRDARQAGVKGVRVGMRASTIREKMAAHTQEV